MTIHKRENDTPVCAGDWILPKSFLRDQITDRPLKVARVSKSRVYTTKGTRETFITYDSVVFVCDTEYEAELAFAIVEAHYRALAVAEERLYNEAIAKVLAINELKREGA